MTLHDGKGERFRLFLEGWGKTGETLAHHEGQQVQVFGGMPGEEVLVQEIRHRPGYIAAQVIEVLTSSPYRVSPPCPYFGPCTGCQWQHIDYQHQLRLKRQMVLDALGAVDGFDPSLVRDTLHAPEEYGYRNHARFTVGRRKGELGFVNRETRRFIPVQKCLLMHSWINEALAQLQGRCSETSQLSLRYGMATGDFLIQPKLANQEVPLPSGQKHYRELLDGKAFRIASSSFFQVNTRQAERMVELVKEGLALSGKEVVVDAYAGVGTFAISLAPHAAEVIAIEESTSAVKDAVSNAEGVDGVRFLVGKTEDVLADIEDRPHGVVLDPPRAGCQQRALDALLRLAPRRVVYVSCDPETLARDLEILCRETFRLERVQPIDMFPQTHHVECIATLSFREHISPDGNIRSLGMKTPHVDERRIVLASTSPRRRELMSSLGLEVEVTPPSVSETVEVGEGPDEMVKRLALSKAGSVARSLERGLVVGADTVVVLDDQVLGKPADPEQAREMLRRLRGRQHRVLTGVAVADASSSRVHVSSQVSTVTMREYSEGEIDSYVASGEPMDKAGAYGVQDPAFRPVERLEGCYANVVGLPVCLLVELLEGAGIGFDHGVRVPDGCSQCSLGEVS